MKAWKHASASQLKTYIRCPSAWHWNKIMGLEQPTSAAMELGSEVHTELENYLKTGDESGLGPIPSAVLGTGFLPPVPHPPELIERSLKLKTPVVPLIGFIDFEEPDKRRVSDHKTTSDWRYTKEPAELGRDVQAIIYMKDALDRWGDAGPITFRHVYYKTRGGNKCRQSEVSLHPNQITERFNKLLPVLTNMQEDATKPPEEIPVNTDACGDYGGCPYKADCRKAGKIDSFSGFFDPEPTTENKNQENKTMSTYSKMLQARQAALQGASKIAPAVVNPPDGVSMTAIPEPPTVEDTTHTTATPGTTSRGAFKYEGNLISTMSKKDLAAAWVTLNNKHGSLFELQWTGEGKATRTTIQADVIAMIGEPPPEGTKMDKIVEKHQKKAVEVSKAITRHETAGWSKGGEAKDEGPSQDDRTDRAQRAIDLQNLNDTIFGLESKLAKRDQEILKLVEERGAQPTEDVTIGQPPTLYIGCHPQGSMVVYADELISDLQDQVAEGAAVSHYLMLEYGEGPKRVASHLRAAIMNDKMELPRALAVDRRNPCADAILDVLIPFYRKVGGLVIERMG